METLNTVLLILLVADAVALVLLVLIQQGKGADVGAAFGSGSANTLFGSSSSSFLTKSTVWLAIGFFVISFGLAYLAKERAAALTSFGLPEAAAEVELPLDEDQGDADGEDADGEIADDDAGDNEPASGPADELPDV